LNLDIDGWLRGIGLEQYAQTFRDNEIDEAVLPNLTSEDLRELGVTIVGHRRKLLTAIGELSGSPSAPITIAELPAAAEPQRAGDTAERRQLTVLFVDLVGSTALSARLDLEDMREIVGAYHRSCAEQITNAGGFVAKYMGDGVLAYFGYPQAHEHDAERAVLAGLALVEAMPKLKTGAGTPLQVRVGIATGLVVVGDLIGSGEAQERGVVGDTPNLAARLQALAEPNMVVIADSTRRLLGNLFELRDLGPQDLKGIAGPARMPPQASYLFKHALVQDAAYGTLLRSRRQQLHARIGATLEDQFPEIVVTQPALLAQHCAEAGLAEKAVAFWLKAGRQAMAGSAMTEAVAQLRKGLDVLTGLPDDPRRRQLELDLQLALRPALAFTKGLSAPDVGETIARARALAEQLDRPEYLVRLSFGQWAFHFGRSEHKLALSLAEQIEKSAEARNDLRTQLRGRRAHGLTLLHLGEFDAARALLDQCHGLADPAHRGIGAGLAEDPYATTLAYLALTLAYLGYIDQSRVRLDEALSEARRFRHAQTLAGVLLYAGWFAWITCPPELGRSEELMAISNEHRFPFHLGFATAMRGASFIALGQPSEGLRLSTEGLEALRATGTVISTPLVLMWLADAYALVGQPADGLNCLAEAARIIETTEERNSEAELYRLQGDFLNATGDQPAAERSDHQALAVAKLQSAKLMELRASISLARLWYKQDRRGEARDLLAPIYGWFTEGFDARDLKAAKALLEELAA
jgi:class 3 adenylate cyclase